MVTAMLSSCSTGENDNQDLKNYIPSDTQMVIKLLDPAQLAADLGRNELSRALGQDPAIAGFLENQNMLSELRPRSYAYLLGQSHTDIQLITHYNDPAVFKADSIDGLQKEQILQDAPYPVYRLTLESDTLYQSGRDSILVLGTSKEKIGQLLDEQSSKEQTDPFWKEQLALKTTKNLAFYQRAPFIYLGDSLKVKMADLRLLELDITASRFNMRGMARALDSSSNFVNLFRGQEPQQSVLFDLLPVEAVGARSFTYRDADGLITRLGAIRKDSVTGSFPLLLETLHEIGQIDLKEGSAFFAESLDVSLTEEQLEPYLEEFQSFRDVPLYSFTRPKLLGKWFSPLLDTLNTTIAFRLDDHFVFADKSTTAEVLIRSYQNNAVVAKSNLLKNTGDDVLNRITAQFVFLDAYVSKGLYQALGYSTSEAPAKKVGDYAMGVFQLVGEKDFAHINYTARESSGSRELSSGLSQLATIKLDTPIMSQVQLFSNHRTSGLDIVFQDINNDLSLYSSSGKRLWKRTLDGPVLGRIQEVDLLRNGKKQMAFTTASRLYVIDRNGKDVAPFPVSFKDAITQPLAVFDYDNNRKYRFAVVQGKEILLYDSNARVVSGFRFRSAGSAIVLPPQHLRIGNKDYVLIAEENGRLNILSRVGRTRVEVDQRFEFSENPIAKEGENFVVITSDNKKVTIAPNGRISSTSIEVSPDFYFGILKRDKVTLDENLLRINGKLTELPFGVYSKPGLFQTGNQVLVGLTETQEKKVYLFNNKGALLPGLPAYGSSTPDFGRSRSEGNLMLVKAGDQQIILYRLGN
jgi:hypothetical protein